MTPGSVVFHSPGDLEIAAVAGEWQRPPLEWVLDSEACFAFGNGTYDVCDKFADYCLQRGEAAVRVASDELPTPNYNDPDFDEWESHERQMAVVRSWQPPPVFINLDTITATHLGEVVWPPPRRKQARRPVRIYHPPGEPFPVPDVRTAVLVNQPERARDAHRWLPAFCARR